jgi:ankyrin repeat protein
MTFESVTRKFTTRGLRLDDVRRYLDAGGDICRRDQETGWSLLHFAAEDGNPEVIRFLAARGADRDVADRNGCTPLHLAVDRDMDTSSRGGRRARELPTIQTLIDVGAEENVRSANGATPRDMAVAYGQEALYDSLLRPKSA